MPPERTRRALPPRYVSEEDHGAAVGVLMKAANSPRSPRKGWGAQAGRTRPGDWRSQGAGQGAGHGAGSGSRAARGEGSPAGSGRARRGAGRGGRAVHPSTAVARRSHTAGEGRNAAARRRRRHTGRLRRAAGSRAPESIHRAHAVRMPCVQHLVPQVSAMASPRLEPWHARRRAPWCSARASPPAGTCSICAICV